MSLFGASPNLHPPGSDRHVRISSADSARMRSHYGSPTDFVRMASPEGLREMMRWGEEHVNEMDASGMLDSFLPSVSQPV